MVDLLLHPCHCGCAHPCLWQIFFSNLSVEAGFVLKLSCTQVSCCDASSITMTKFGCDFFFSHFLDNAMVYHILKQSPNEKLRDPIVIHSPPGKADLIFLPFSSFSLKCEEAMVWLISSPHCSECLLPCFCSPFSGGLELPRDESVGREKRQNRRFLL